MPTKRKAMRQIKEVLRLKFEAKLSHERIAAATGLSKGAVTRYLKRALEAGIGWPLAPQMDDAVLEAQLFRSAGAPAAGHVAPDFAHIHQELKRKGVTLTLLWEEYSAAHPGCAYRYSQFCFHYGQFRESLKRSMRQVHRAGEKLFLDYCGNTVPIIDAGSGEARAQPRSSSPCWARPTTPTPRRASRSSFPTGLARTSVPLNSSARCRHSWCPIT